MFCRRRTLILILAGLLIALVLVPLGANWLGNSTPRFESVTDFVKCSQEHGLYVHGGKQDANDVKGICFISDKPLTLEQVSTLAPPQGGLTPAWEGCDMGIDHRKEAIWPVPRISGPELPGRACTNLGKCRGYRRSRFT